MPDVSWCEKGGKRGYVTTRPLEWWIGKKESGWMLVVPTGREFESSVPRWLWWVFSPDDPYFLKSAAIHDTLLEAEYRLWFSDSQWFEAALSEKAPAYKAIPAYLGMVVRRLTRWTLSKNK